MDRAHGGQDRVVLRGWESARVFISASIRHGVDRQTEARRTGRMTIVRTPANRTGTGLRLVPVFCSC